MTTTKSIVLVDGEAPPRLVPSKRFTLALLVFFAFYMQYAQRVNLPIGIVCMANRTKLHEQRISLATTSTTENNVAVHIADDRIYLKSTTIAPIMNKIEKFGFLQEKQFNWIQLQEQILLGSYWAGYIFTQIPGTYIDLIFFRLFTCSYKLI